MNFYKDILYVFIDYLFSHVQSIANFLSWLCKIIYKENSYNSLFLVYFKGREGVFINHKG